MRPRRVRLGYRALAPRRPPPTSFNEAEARAPRIRRPAPSPRGPGSRFNEAEARAPRIRLKCLTAERGYALLQ